MKSHIILILALLFFSIHIKTYGQESVNDTVSAKQNPVFHYKQFIIPVVLIGYGSLGTGMESDWLRLVNAEVKEEVDEHIDSKFTFDDISQYIPALSVYALNSVGVKGKSNFRDRTIILATSYLIMTTTVTGLKMTTNIRRPDDSSNNSFPSGHTATAFMGAEFLWQEYKDVSVWYGISGYAIAAGTGFFRMYNNRHWLTDVAAGAGIGILSTKIAYMVNPYISKKLFGKKSNEPASAIIYPYYNGEQFGVGFAMSF